MQLLCRPPKRPQKQAPSLSSAAPDGGQAQEDGNKKPKARKGRRKPRYREPPLVDDRPIVELVLSRTDPGGA